MRLRLFLLFCWLPFCVDAQEAVPVCQPEVEAVGPKADLKSVFGVINMGNLQVINSPDLDYNAVLVHDGVIFTSTRVQEQADNSTTASGRKLSSWKKKLSTLFYSELHEGRLSMPAPLEGDVNEQYHESSACFTYSGNIMFFTRSSARKSRTGKRQLKIYMAERVDGTWTNIQELPFNGEDFSTCHPSISKDGTRLYFASNRPGGFGGMDIYVATYRNNRWSAPLNLGPVINSAGSEVFPYISQDEVLYFSSSDQGGLGKLDIFRSKKMQGNSERTWQLKQNLGEPFNSTGDDFGFYVNADNSGGLFTSSRKGGKGRDDIYFWQLTTQPIFQCFEEGDSEEKETDVCMVEVDDCE